MRADFYKSKMNVLKKAPLVGQLVLHISCLALHYLSLIAKGFSFFKPRAIKDSRKTHKVAAGAHHYNCHSIPDIIIQRAAVYMC
jgi:hypothetical protein